LTIWGTISFSNSQNRFCSKESFNKILHVGKLRFAKFGMWAPDFLMTQINNSRQRHLKDINSVFISLQIWQILALFNETIKKSPLSVVIYCRIDTKSLKQVIILYFNCIKDSSANKVPKSQHMFINKFQNYEETVTVISTVFMLKAGWPRNEGEIVDWSKRYSISYSSSLLNAYLKPPTPKAKQRG
jgi:hypothetical protein